jgi:putative ABC transport system permease protein
MIAAVRRRLQQTHSAGIELLRHFLAGFFDNEMVTIPGEWQKTAIGIFASLVSITFVALFVYEERYKYLHAAAFSVYRQGVRDDLVSFIALGMLVTALLTILQWQSLFLSLRDCLALASLPVSPREIFLAKFGSLIVIFAGFVAAMTAMPSLLFPILTGDLLPTGHWFENPNYFANAAGAFAALSGACVCVFFSLVTLQAILLHLLPPRLFSRVSLAVQGGLFILTVGAVPLMGRQPASAAWWPPHWFVSLWEAIVIGRRGAAPALLAMLIPIVLAFIAYLLSYHRYRRLLLESPAGHRPEGGGQLGARLLERWIREPREQAAFAFIWKTLARSRSHRLLLLAYAGVALGWIAKGMLDAPPVKLRDEGVYGLTVVLAPIAISILITVGLRYLFTLPVMLRAQWVFQIVEAEDRAAWQAAIVRFVIWVGIAPVFAAGLPATIAVLGLTRGIGATALSAAVGLIFFERYFRDWRKLPFTCSYLPGRQPVWLMIVKVAMSSAYLVPIAQLVLWASGEQTSFAAAATLGAAWWWWWRGKRRAEWRQASMIWDEAPEGAVMQLGLETASRQETPLMASGRPQEVATVFTGSMVASRGLLPAAWAEEIDDDRRDRRAFWQSVLEDVRYGVRLIWRSPLFSAVVVATLTVGIGINASVFTVFDRLGMKAHVSGDPASFVRIFPQSQRDGHERAVSSAEYVALRDRNRSLRQLAAFRIFAAVLGEDDSTGTPALAVSCNFFQVEGLDRPLMGRLLDASDCATTGRQPVALISEKIWRDRFSADPHIIGRAARINNVVVPIVGVVPVRTSLWVQPVGVWVPYTSQPDFDVERTFLHDDLLWLFLAGRMKPGYSQSMVAAEFTTLERQLDALTPGRRTAVETTDGSWIANFELRATGRDLFLLSFFFGAFYLVLLIACANVATLLLSRAASRRREITVRLSLGAPRIRLVRMLVTESLLLAAIAGGISTWLVYHVPEPLFRFLSPPAPPIPMPPDWGVFIYLAAVVMLTGILSGVAPAVESVKVDLASAIKGNAGSAGSTYGGSKLRGWLVTAQVAMSMVLLVEAALFGKSEDRNLNADPGYLPHHVVVSLVRFRDGTPPEVAQSRFRRIADHLRAAPGVRDVAYSDDLPMISSHTVQLRPPSRPDAVQPVDVYSASAGFMNTLGVPLVHGRDFVPGDTSAVIISESLARIFFRRANPVGQSLRFAEGEVTIIGVAKDIAPLRVGGSDNPPVWRTGITRPLASFLSVRFAAPRMATAQAVRASVSEIEPNLVLMARNLQSWIDLVTEGLWNLITLIVILGAVATVLATMGIYGAVSFTVNQRMHDLGIRVALGARRADIVREVLRMGGRPVLRGLLVGSWISVAFASTLRENLRGTVLRIDSSDPLVYVLAMVLLGFAALLAMLGPARRGSRSNPLEALRTE